MGSHRQRGPAGRPAGVRFDLAIRPLHTRPEAVDAITFESFTALSALAALRDHLQVITRMLAPGRATFDGRYATVADAINEPRGLQQPRLPIMLGGNGPKGTWRLAARHADELDLDGMTPDEVVRALPVIRSRCEEIGRDPATLRVSVRAWSWWRYPRADQPDPAEYLAAYREAGVDRV